MVTVGAGVGVGVGVGVCVGVGASVGGGAGAGVGVGVSVGGRVGAGVGVGVGVNVGVRVGAGAGVVVGVGSVTVAGAVATGVEGKTGNSGPLSGTGARPGSSETTLLVITYCPGFTVSGVAAATATAIPIHEIQTTMIDVKSMCFFNILFSPLAADQS